MYNKTCKRIFRCGDFAYRLLFMACPTTIPYYATNIVSAGIAVWNKSYNFAKLKDSYMNQQIVYNLEEFAKKYQLKDIYGAYAAHLSITGEESGNFSEIDVSKSEDVCSMCSSSSSTSCPTNSAPYRATLDTRRKYTKCSCTISIVTSVRNDRFASMPTSSTYQ